MRIKLQNLNVSGLVLQLSLPNPLKPDVENEDVVGVAPTGDALSTYEWSTVLLPTKVRLILEVWRYMLPNGCYTPSMSIHVIYSSRYLSTEQPLRTKAYTGGK